MDASASTQTELVCGSNSIIAGQLGDVDLMSVMKLEIVDLRTFLSSWFLDFASRLQMQESWMKRHDDRLESMLELIGNHGNVTGSDGSSRLFVATEENDPSSLVPENQWRFDMDTEFGDLVCPKSTSSSSIDSSCRKGERGTAWDEEDSNSAAIRRRAELVAFTKNDLELNSCGRLIRPVQSNCSGGNDFENILIDDSISRNKIFDDFDSQKITDSSTINHSFDSNDLIAYLPVKPEFPCTSGSDIVPTSSFGYNEATKKRCLRPPVQLPGVSTNYRSKLIPRYTDFGNDELDSLSEPKVNQAGERDSSNSLLRNLDHSTVEDEARERGALRRARHQCLTRDNRCTKCNVKFKSLSAAYRHIREVHVFHSRFECEYCGKRFTRREMLDSHLVKHGTEKDCVGSIEGDSHEGVGGVCMKQMTKKGVGKTDDETSSRFEDTTLNDSESSDQEEPNGAVSSNPICSPKGDYKHWVDYVTSNNQCTICHTKLKNRKYASKHIRVQHFGMRKFTCQMCHEKHRDLSCLRRHFRCRHPGVAVTEVQLGAMKDVGRHWLRARRRVKLDLQQPEENNIIAESKAVQKSEPSVTPVKCDQQSVELPVKSSSERNDYSTFIGRGPRHNCLKCGMAFNQRRYAVEHVRKVHFSTNLQHACRHCGSRFLYRSRLSDHLLRCRFQKKSKHSSNSPLSLAETLSDSGQNTMACVENHKQSSDRDGYISEIVAYKCTPCNLKFSTLSVLQRHFRHAHREVDQPLSTLMEEVRQLKPGGSSAYSTNVRYPSNQRRFASLANNFGRSRTNCGGGAPVVIGAGSKGPEPGRLVNSIANKILRTAKERSLNVHDTKNRQGSFYDTHIVNRRTCRTCGATFTNRSNLIRHLRTVHSICSPGNPKTSPPVPESKPPRSDDDGNAVTKQQLRGSLRLKSDDGSAEGNILGDTNDFQSIIDGGLSVKLGDICSPAAAGSDLIDDALESLPVFQSSQGGDDDPMDLLNRDCSSNPDWSNRRAFSVDVARRGYPKNKLGYIKPVVCLKSIVVPKDDDMNLSENLKSFLSQNHLPNNLSIDSSDNDDNVEYDVEWDKEDDGTFGNERPCEAAESGGNAPPASARPSRATSGKRISDSWPHNASNVESAVDDASNFAGGSNCDPNGRSQRSNRRQLSRLSIEDSGKPGCSSNVVRSEPAPGGSGRRVSPRRSHRTISVATPTDLDRGKVPNHGMTSRDVTSSNRPIMTDEGNGGKGLTEAESTLFVDANKEEFTEREDEESMMEEEEGEQEEGGQPSEQTQGSSSKLITKEDYKTFGLPHFLDGRNKCKLCGVIYTNRKSAIQHIRYRHIMWKSIQCSLCEEKFTRMTNLKRHMERQHHGVQA